MVNLKQIFESENKSNSVSELDNALNLIDNHRSKIRISVNKLEAKRDELYKSAISSGKTNDMDKMLIYKEEHAEIDNVISSINLGSNALTKILIRLQSFNEINFAFTNLLEAIKLAKQVSNDTSKILHNFTSISDIYSEVNETLKQIDISDNHFQLKLNNHGSQIIESAQKHIDKDPTKPDNSSENKNTGSNVMSPINHSQQSNSQHSQNSSDINNKVYDYCIRHPQEELNISEASIALGIQKQQLEQVVLNLIAEKKIKLYAGMISK